LQEAVDEAKGHLEATDKEELEKAAKDLSDKIMPIGAKMYEQAQKDEQPAKDKTEGQKTDKDEPIEGEVVDDKKEK